MTRTERAKQASNLACISSKRLATLANSISDNLEESSGIPVRPLSEDDSMVTVIDAAVEAQLRAKRSTGSP